VSWVRGAGTRCYRTPLARWAMLGMARPERACKAATLLWGAPCLDRMVGVGRRVGGGSKLAGTVGPTPCFLGARPRGSGASGQGLGLRKMLG